MRSGLSRLVGIKGAALDGSRKGRADRRPEVDNAPMSQEAPGRSYQQGVRPDARYAVMAPGRRLPGQPGARGVPSTATGASLPRNAGPIGAFAAKWRAPCTDLPSY